jgi:hypothetical protein
MCFGGGQGPGGDYDPSGCQAAPATDGRVNIMLYGVNTDGAYWPAIVLRVVQVQSSGFGVIIWLTCSGGILAGQVVGARMRSAWDGSGLCRWPVLEAGQAS